MRVSVSYTNLFKLNDYLHKHIHTPVMTISI